MNKLLTAVSISNPTIGVGPRVGLNVGVSVYQSCNLDWRPYIAANRGAELTGRSVGLSVSFTPSGDFDGFEVGTSVMKPSPWFMSIPSKHSTLPIKVAFSQGVHGPVIAVCRPSGLDFKTGQASPSQPYCATSPLFRRTLPQISSSREVNSLPTTYSFDKWLDLRLGNIPEKAL